MRDFAFWWASTLLQTRPERMWYAFENVFDWRSGPRRGRLTAPIPTQHLP